MKNVKNTLKFRNINGFGVWFKYKDDRICWCWPWKRFGPFPYSKPDKDFKWLSSTFSLRFKTLGDLDQYWSEHMEQYEHHYETFKRRLGIN
jgi:hypothetical protein